MLVLLKRINKCFGRLGCCCSGGVLLLLCRDGLGLVCFPEPAAAAAAVGKAHVLAAWSGSSKRRSESRDEVLEETEVSDTREGGRDAKLHRLPLSASKEGHVNRGRLASSTRTSGADPAGPYA